MLRFISAKKISEFYIQMLTREHGSRILWCSFYHFNFEQLAQFLAPKPRGLGLADDESANCLLDSALLFLLAVPGGA